MPDTITTLLTLIAQLPPGLQSSSRQTHHFELTAPHDAVSYWWLDLGDMLHPYYTANPHAYHQALDRLQLLLDLAAAAKAAETQLIDELNNRP